MRITGLAALAVLGIVQAAAGQGGAPAAAAPAGKDGAQPAAAAQPVFKRDDAAAEKLGWRLAVQAWTFRDRTAFEAIETTQRLGVKYIELYPGQALSKEHPGEKVGPDLGAERRAELKKKLAECGVRALNFGVVSPSKNEEEAKKIFDFCKDLGIDTITCEPEMDAWDTVEKLCYQYNINAAVHNHPKPSRYWSPDIVAKTITERAMRVGVCADTGHWSRSGLKPADCLKKLRGRIISLHFKDIAGGEDKPWGTGDGDARGMLRELYNQGFRGVVALEYESGSGPELEANAQKCVEFFDKTAAELAQDD